MAGKGRRKNPASPAKAGRLENVPLWMQGFAAIAGVLLTALGVFGLVGNGNGDPEVSSSPAASTPGAVPSVSLRLVTTDGGEIVGLGTFQDLDPATDAILFIGQPEGGDSEWLPVVASTTPTNTTPDGRQDGDWRAVRPAVDGRYTWYAVVGPRVAGADDFLDDLRDNGPEADLARAVSGPFTTGE